MSNITTAYPKYTGKEPCRSTDPDAFFPEQHLPNLYVQLKRICDNCEMLSACADYAIRFEDLGYWGGLSPSERRRIRQARGISISSELRQSAA